MRVSATVATMVLVLDMRIDNEGVATGCKKTCCKGVSASLSESEEIDVQLLQQYIATGCKKISVATLNVVKEWDRCTAVATLMDVLGNVHCSNKLTTNKQGHHATIATVTLHMDGKKRAGALVATG